MKLVKSLRAIVSLYVLACLLGPGFADPENDQQVKDYEPPRLGNSSMGYCPPNQYWDYEEGRCFIVPGGGTVKSIDNNKKCNPETMRARPPARNSYYVCRPTKTIYAECEHDPIYDARLKKCTPDTRESDDIQPVHDNSNGANASCDHVDLPPCKTSGRYPIPSKKCCYYTCQSNGHRLTQEVHMCHSKGFDPETGECTSDDVCNNNGVTNNEETNTTAEGLSEDLESPMENTTSAVKSDDEKERGSTLKNSEAGATTVHPDSPSITDEAMDDSITTVKPEDGKESRSTSGYSQAETTTVKPDTTTAKVITDKAVTSPVDDSTDTSVTYRSTPETTTEVSTIKLQPTLGETESSTQDSVKTTEGQDGKESSSTLNNFNIETTTAQPDVSTISRKGLTTTELPKKKIQSTEDEVETSTESSITPVNLQDGKESRSTSGYSQAETTTVKPDTTTDKVITDKAVTSPVDDSTDTSVTYRTTSETTTDVSTIKLQPTLGEIESSTQDSVKTTEGQDGKESSSTLNNFNIESTTAQPAVSTISRKGLTTTVDDSTGTSVRDGTTSATTTELPKKKIQSTEDEAETSTESSITPVKLQDGKKSRSTSGYSQADTTTVKPDTTTDKVITDKAVTSPVDDTTNTPAYTSPSTPSSESKGLNRKERSTTMQDASTSSTDPDEINHENTWVPTIRTSTLRPSTLEPGETTITTTFDNLYAAASTAQTDQSSNTDKTAITSYDSTDSSDTYKSTSAAPTELSKIKIQSTEDEVEISTESLITPVKLQDGKKSRSTSGYSQAETTTVKPDTTTDKVITDKAVTSPVDDTTNTPAYTSPSTPSSESKGLNRKEISTQMQDASTSSTDPDEINHENTWVPTIRTSTLRPSTLEPGETTITTTFDNLYAAASTAQTDQSSNTDKTAITSYDSTDSSVTYKSTSAAPTELSKIKIQSTEDEVEISTESSITPVKLQDGKKSRSTSGYSQAETTTVKPDTTTDKVITDKAVTSPVDDTTNTPAYTSPSTPSSESKGLNRKERSTTMQDASTSSTDPDEINHENTWVPTIRTSTLRPSTLEPGETTITTTFDNLYAAASTAQTDQSSNTDKTAITSYDSTDSSVTYKSTSAAPTELSKIKIQSTEDEVEISTESSITPIKLQDGKKSRSTSEYSQAETTTVKPDTTTDKVITDKPVTSTVVDTTNTPAYTSPSTRSSESKGLNRKERSTPMQDASTSSTDPDEINHETTWVPAIRTSTLRPSTLEPGETTITTTFDNLYAATSTAQPDQSSNTDKTAIAVDHSTEPSITYRSTSATTTDASTIKLQSGPGEIESSTDNSVSTVKPQAGKESKSTSGSSQAEATTLSPGTAVDKTVTSTVDDTTNTSSTDTSTSIPSYEPKDLIQKERSTTVQDTLTPSTDSDEIIYETAITTTFDNVDAATSSAQPDQSSNTDKTAIASDDSTDSSVTYESTSSPATELPKIKSQSRQGEVETSTDDSVSTVKPQERKELGCAQAEAATAQPDTAANKGLTSTVDDTTDTFDTDMSASIPTSESKDLKRKKRSASMQDALTPSTDSDEINYETAITTTFDNLYAATSTAQPDRYSNVDKTVITLDDSTDSSITYKSISATITELPKINLQSSLGDVESSPEDSITKVQAHDGKVSNFTIEHSNTESTSQSDVSNIPQEGLTTIVDPFFSSLKRSYRNTLAYEAVTPTYDTSEIKDGAKTTETIENRWTKIFTASGFTRPEMTDGT